MVGTILTSSTKWHTKYDNIRKIATVLGDDYTTGCLLDYPYFKGNCKLITIDLSKQQAVDALPKWNSKLIYKKSRMCWEYNNILHYWRNQRNYPRFLTRSSKNMVNVLCKFYFVSI